MLECALMHTPVSLFHPWLCCASCLKTLMQTTVLYIFVVKLKQLFFNAGVCSCAYSIIVVPPLVVLCVLLENTHANYDPISFCGAIEASIPGLAQIIVWTICTVHIEYRFAAIVVTQ